MCKIRSEENKNNCKRERNQIRKIVSRAMKKEAEQQMNDLCHKPSNVLKLLTFLKKGRIRLKLWTMFERKKWQIYVQREESKKSVEKTYGKKQ